MNDQQAARLRRDVDRLLRREGLLAATFVQSAASVDDVLTVVVPSYDDGEHPHGDPDGVVWHPRVDDDGDPVYPSEKDPAWVMEASDGRWVVLAWMPA